jgi:hypothetical protein
LTNSRDSAQRERHIAKQSEKSAATILASCGSGKKIQTVLRKIRAGMVVLPTDVSNENGRIALGRAGASQFTLIF